MTTIIKAKKIGKNRGKPRLWIEGKMLLNNDWIKGVQFQVEYFPTGVRIDRGIDSNHTVAGSFERPIIDLNNSQLPDIDGATYTMIIDPNTITLELN